MANSRPTQKQRQHQLEKAISRMQELADKEGLCRCLQCKTIKDVLKAWKVKP